MSACRQPATGACHLVSMLRIARYGSLLAALSWGKCPISANWIG